MDYKLRKNGSISWNYWSSFQNLFIFTIFQIFNVLYDVTAIDSDRWLLKKVLMGTY